LHCKGLKDVGDFSDSLPDGLLNRPNKDCKKLNFPIKVYIKLRLHLVTASAKYVNVIGEVLQPKWSNFKAYEFNLSISWLVDV